jgi:hypothetical protein
MLQRLHVYQHNVLSGGILPCLSLGGSFPYKYTIYLCMSETDSAQALPLIRGRQRLIV